MTAKRSIVTTKVTQAEPLSMQVVACDIEKYSKRRASDQLRVVCKFTELLKQSCLAILSGEGHKSSMRSLPRSRVSVMPTGDGVVVAFHRPKSALHLKFALHVLAVLDKYNTKDPCRKFEESGWCGCHDRFRIRIGIGEGKCVTYKDINDKRNIAGNAINYAVRVMALANPMQIMMTMEAHRDLMDFHKDAGLETAFQCHAGVAIKHGEAVNVYQYVKSAPGLDAGQSAALQPPITAATSLGSQLSEDAISAIAAGVAAQLGTDWDWASAAIERAHMGGFAETLFGDRRGHFRREKEHIAEFFAPLLFRRALQLTKGHSLVYILIDSGTTLFPLFRLLGKLAVEAHFEGLKPLHQIRIVTNNLPGVLSIMEHGRPNPDNRYSDLAVECQLLPGVPLPVYKAVTGPLTEAAIKVLRGHAESDQGAERPPAFIGVMTGNWIRIRRTQPPCPIPLARGAGHLGFKQALLNACDEVFVLAPLGKCFANIGLSEVNEALGYEDRAKDPGRVSYRELRISNRKAATVSLVTTYREKGRLLRDLGSYLQTVMESDISRNVKDFDLNALGEVGHSIIEFDKLPDDPIAEEEIELPHKATRDGVARMRLLSPQGYAPQPRARRVR